MAIPHPARYPHPQVKMNKVRWGIIGAGDVCERKSGPPLYKVQGSELSLVHRRNQHAAEDFIGRHGHGRYVSSVAELVGSEEIDAVYVASPHELHCEHTIAALNAGKHVLVEKPMATSTSECDAMLAAAARNERSLAVAYYRRGYPSIQLIHRWLTDGNLPAPKEMFLCDEFPTSHRLDLVHFLLGELKEARTLPANPGTYRFESQVERFEVQAQSGALVRMFTGWAESGMPESLRLAGDGWQLHLLDLKGGKLLLERERHHRLELPGTLPFTHTGLIENFVDHLTNGTPLLCDGVEGRKSTVVLDSLEHGPTDGIWFPVSY